MNIRHYCGAKMSKVAYAPKACANDKFGNCMTDDQQQYITEAYYRQVFETGTKTKCHPEDDTSSVADKCPNVKPDPKPKGDECMTWTCIDHYSQTIRVHIENGQFTESKDTFSKADPYTVMTLDGPLDSNGKKNNIPPYDQVVRTHVITNAGMDPAWNFE
jgi:hypothetical protein